MPQLIESLKVGARSSVCKGFAVGRTITAEPARKWFKNEISDEELIAQTSANYLLLINAWLNRQVSNIESVVQR
ncbi:hypothetical protein RJ43_12485 [Alteromonas macleodii]|nr:hypothetical protein RJ43_12485 [Alteromonas macleodii]